MRNILLCLGLLVPAMADAQTDLRRMTAGERAAFGEEVRATLLASPDIVAAALDRATPMQTAVRDAFRAEVAEDMDLLTRLAPQVLASHDIALFVGDLCEGCTRAIEELRTLSDTSGVTFILHDIADPETAVLAKTLGLDMVPSYVLPDMVLRGHIPALVLQRYLTR